jgi:adenine-specific DNA methylase
LIFDPEELWFEKVLQGAVLLLAEKKPSSKHSSKGVAIIPTKDRSFLQKNPESYFRNANYVNGDILSGIKWMRALLTEQERKILDSATQQKNVARFDKVADVDVGIVTGANKFFLVPDDVVAQYKLGKWAHPMFGRSEHVRGVIYNEQNHENNRKLGLPTNFIWFKESDDDLKGLAKDYITKGELEDLHKRYKCRIRSPWYAVPSVYTTPVGMLKRCHDFPRLIYNKANAFTTDTAYRIKTKNGVSPNKLVFSFVNSLTALCAELEGRHYGGGVLELVPSEIERVFIPLPKGKVKLSQLDNDIKSGMGSFDILKKQDDILLEQLGISKADRSGLFSAWLRLRNRRQRVGN